ncbi:protein adenylyltransferase SelO [Leeia oryzae]|uniref:protein adenylyltransferase SelO n=1 Tax=Leeia oryzae TaxID=356662 RepID=UPI00037450BC|nr:YdiU family protein [Leeia oryzae]
MSTLQQLNPLNRFARQLPDWHRPQRAEPLPAPYLVHVSALAAGLLGLTEDACRSEAMLAMASGNVFPDWCEPVATVYSGHQFGVCVPQLGDGRALLLGEVEGTNGLSWEVQLKGAGRTPFSRHADGRAVLRSSIREYLCSEAMFGLGVPTTRALAIIGSPLPVYRETVETASVVIRLAPRFVRFGHFEFAFLQGNTEQARQLADFVIAHDLPECQQAPNPYLAMLDTVMHRTANLMADWQAVGFCHGVMNTDNMSILGLTIDYGPFGFLDAYDPEHICNHTDTYGRYAYRQQPAVGYWNLRVLASVLLPLINDKDAAIELLEQYPAIYQQAFETRMQAKLGWSEWQAEDEALLRDTLQLLADQKVDYTRFWRALSHFSITDAATASAVLDECRDRDAASAWLDKYRARLVQEGSVDAVRQQRMLGTNPKFVLRNHLAEEAIRAARDQQDFSLIDQLMTVLANPFDEHPAFARFADLPPDWAGELEVSCSS